MPEASTSTPGTSTERETKRAQARQYWSTAAAQRLVQLPLDRVLHDADDIAAARTRLKDEEDAIRSVLASILARENALSPIHRLPSEVLALVFQHLSCDWHVGWLPGSEFHSDTERRALLRHRVLRLGWVGTTHVCQRWRQVALDHPSLWGHLSFDLGLEVAEAMLARAKSAPIFANMIILPWNILRSMDTGVPPFLSEHTFHMKALHVEVTPRFPFKSLTTTLTRPAPILDTLEILGGVKGLDALPPALFAGHAPKLRRLELTRIFCLWPSIPTGNLCHLKIDFQEAFTGHHTPLPPSSYNDFFEFLHACPALETLDLSDCLPPCPSSPANRRDAHLLHLTTLTLTGPTNRVLNVLEHVTIPPTTNLDLACSSDDPEDDIAILLTISRHLNAYPSSASFRTLGITADPSEGFGPSALSIEAWRTCYARPEGSGFILSGEDEDKGSDFFLEFEFAGGDPPETRLARVKRLCNALPLSGLERLSVDVRDAPWTARDWVQIFGAYVGVKSLQVFAGETCRLCGALLETLDEDSSQNRTADGLERGPGRMLFPHLKALFLRSTNFVCGPPTAETDPPDLMSWVRSFSERGERGAPLEHLGVEACSISDEDFELLGNEDYHVVWDGVEHGGDEESAEDFDSWDDVTDGEAEDEG